MNAPAPKRRWFRFSLRMLFTIVTVFACWLGYELNWLRQRHRVLDDHLVVHNDRFYEEDLAPGWLWLFGEQAYDELRYLPDWPSDEMLAPFLVLMREKPGRRVSKQELARLQALFPEARFLGVGGGY